MENFKKLLKVKSIVTILLTLVVCYLALFKNYDIKEIYLMISVLNFLNLFMPSMTHYVSL